MNKKIKWLSLAVCILFVFSAISSAVSIKIEERQVPNFGEENMNLQFAKPEIRENRYVKLTVESADACLYNTGKPILPVYSKTLSFSFGTKIVEVECEIPEVKSMVLSEKIVPAPKPIIQGMGKNILEYEMDETIYNSNDLFPDNWFSYHTGGGLDENNEHKTFLTIRVYPVRYSPAMDTIYYVENLDLRITYETPETTLLPTSNDYDLVIITPSRLYTGELHELMEHKNNHGVATTIKTLEEIYDEYSGVDKPEQIKYFIKDAIDTWGIKYVLLVGGMKSLIWGKPRDDANQGTKDWHLPVRYTNLKESGGLYDPGFISDLYYADIYDSEGNFSSWDSNGDGIFANWKFGAGRDTIDFYPDVYVGRLACRNVWEVKIMVNKIINYEKEPADPSWYNKMVVVAGDSHDDTPYGTNYPEGEVICDKALSYMAGFSHVKLYASNKDTDPDHTPIIANIKREIDAGCGHLVFEGHANPASWVTHWPGDFDEWAGGINIFDFPKLRNDGKLPICCIAGGCHNSQFNVTILATMLDRDNSKHMWTYGMPVPECWSWWLTRKIGGGAIATIGYTGLSYTAVGEEGDLDGDGVNDPDCIEALSGYLGIQFYKTFNEGIDILGEAWGSALNKYLNTFPGMDEQSSAKHAEQWPLLGDPSLKIGGYPS